MAAGSFRPPLPGRDRLIQWPAGFGTRFLLTIDVEEEFDWSRPLRRDARATTALTAFPEAWRRFAALGTGLTCLVDHPVATMAGVSDLLGPMVEDRRSAIGAQLHPWVNPPFEAGEEAAGGYPGRLPPALEQAKLAHLTEAVGSAFGRRPVIYRAGRYGLGPGTIAQLAALGYRADTSVRARYDYRADGGPDYRGSGAEAYHAAPGLVELPLTTVHTGPARRAGPPLDRLLSRLPYGRGIAARTGLLRRVALTPEDMPVADALAAVDAAWADGLRLLVLSFHSPSLVPGHTPYVRDAADLRDCWAWWDAVLDRLDRLGITAASLDEVLAAAASDDAALRPPAEEATARTTPGSGAAW